MILEVREYKTTDWCGSISLVHRSKENLCNPLRRVDIEVLQKCSAVFELEKFRGTSIGIILRR